MNQSLLPALIDENTFSDNDTLRAKIMFIRSEFYTEVSEYCTYFDDNMTVKTADFRNAIIDNEEENTYRIIFTGNDGDEFYVVDNGLSEGHDVTLIQFAPDQTTDNGYILHFNNYESIQEAIAEIAAIVETNNATS